MNVIVPGAIDTPGWPHNQMEPKEGDRHKQAIGERAPINRMIKCEAFSLRRFAARYDARQKCRAAYGLESSTRSKADRRYLAAISGKPLLLPAPCWASIT